MQSLEQRPPNKPNFLLILFLFAGGILVIFILAYIFLEVGGSRILPKHHAKEPNSRLVLPANPPSYLG